MKRALKNDLTSEEVKNLFTYDEELGVLRWRHNAGRHGRIPAGTIAGRLNIAGYRYININGSLYLAHRLIWVYKSGEWPPDQVDHIDHNPSNDRWANLRLASGSQNKANSRTYKKTSCKLKGVQAVQKRHSIRYRATVTKDGARHNIGSFDTEIEAHLAYVKAAANLHGEFACAGLEAAHG